MRSRTLLSTMIIGIMLMQVMLPSLSEDAGATSARGGTNDDFLIQEISIGNESFDPAIWVQSDGSVLEYVMKGDLVPVSVSVKRNGNALNSATADLVLEAVHPVGFVAWSVNWTTSEMYGGQTFSADASWTADTAHSILNGSELEGGYALRATVTYFADTKNENDVGTLTVPVAYVVDEMENISTSAGTDTMVPFRYSTDPGVTDAIGRGIWTTDDTGVAGDVHWRHSDPGSNYPSNAFDRLVWGFWPSSQDCGNAIHEGGATQQHVYSYYFCRNLIPSLDLVSMQMHVQAWGVIGSGDDVSLELWRSGGVSLRHNFSTANPMVATGEGQWTNLSWDPTDLLGGHSWFMGLLFESDNSMAAEGYHVDDMIVFAVEKVDEFTLDVTCDDPAAGYTAVPNEVVSLHCMVTNNGYKPQIIRVKTNVSNSTWMDPMNPMLRIDSSHPSNHGMDVQLPATPAGNTTEMWINLSVPAGADVQQQTWNVSWSDGSSQNLGVLDSRQMSVAVKEQYGVSLSSTSPLKAATLNPGESGMVPMKLQNTGNRMATFRLDASFSDTTWTASFSNETGASFLPVTLDRGEVINFNVNVTTGSDSAPENYSFSIRATCTTCGLSEVSGNDVLVRTVEIPPVRDVEIIAETVSISAQADGVSKRVMLTINNLGNDDEIHDLSLSQSNPHLLAFLTANSTGSMDAWDGTVDIFLELPMPKYLEPGLYSTTVRVESRDDSSVFDSVSISVTVEDTAAVDVSADEPDQSYIPGGDSDTVRFEIRNDGNSPDSFTLEIIPGDGMDAELEGLSGSTTPMIPPGGSHNITIRFSFSDGAARQVPLAVKATSTNSPDAVTTGEITFSVGSQDWLRLINTEELVITEAGTHTLTLTLRNQYTGDQTVSIDVRQDSSSSTWYKASSESELSPLILQEQAERSLVIKVDVAEHVLLNLYEDKVTEFEVWAISNTIEDATNATIKVTLKMGGSSDETESDDNKAGGTGGMDILTYVVGVGAILGLMFLLVKVIREGDDEDETPWANEEYESSLGAQYGAVPEAPDVSSFSPPAAAAPLPNIPEPAAPMPSIPEPAAPVPEPAPAAHAGAPPIPESGLPEGWTMEQWTHYGAQWLEKNS